MVGQTAMLALTSGFYKKYRCKYNTYRVYPRIGRTRVWAAPQTFNGFHGKKKIVRSSTGINKPKFEINNKFIFDNNFYMNVKIFKL